MSSGSISSSDYHRAQRLGEGGFGSVRTVYDNDGQVYAVRVSLSFFFFLILTFEKTTFYVTVETLRRGRG